MVREPDEGEEVADFDSRGAESQANDGRGAGESTPSSGSIAGETEPVEAPQAERLSQVAKDG